MAAKVNFDGEDQRVAGATVHGRGGVAPALWADVDIVPERSEWDAEYP